MPTAAAANARTADPTATGRGDCQSAPFAGQSRAAASVEAAPHHHRKPEGRDMARKNPTLPAKASARSASEARADLVARAARNAEGATLCRSDPLGDAQAVAAVVRAVESHAAELSRRGLDGAFCEAALQLAREIEHHLQAMPAAAVSARVRSQDAAELLADAAATAQAVRTAVLRVTRSSEGRRVARDFGLGDPFSTRQPPIPTSARVCSRYFHGWRNDDICAASLPGPPAKVPFTASGVHGLMEGTRRGTR